MFFVFICLFGFPCAISLPRFYFLLTEMQRYLINSEPHSLRQLLLKPECLPYSLLSLLPATDHFKTSLSLSDSIINCKCQG